MLNILNGFLITLGLIIGVGPVNSFIIKQGIKRQYVLPVVSFASIFEYALIVLGVKGIATFIVDSKVMMRVLAYIGVVFLIIYGSLLLNSAFKKHNFKNLEAVSGSASLKKTMMITAVLLFFNPGLFVEASIVIGGIGARFNVDNQIFFLAGSAIGVFTWFFGIGYGSARMSHFFTSDKTWKYLEIFSASVMFVASFILIRFITLQ